MRPFQPVFALVCAASLLACGKDPPSASGAAPSGSAKAAAAPTSAATSATTAAAKAAVAGIKPGEIVGLVCDTVSKDSECAEFVVNSEAEKAKMLEDGKKLCPTATAGNACPSPSKIVGTCRVMKFAINHYYSEGGKPYTPATAKAACEKNHGHLVE